MKKTFLLTCMLLISIFTYGQDIDNQTDCDWLVVVHCLLPGDCTSGSIPNYPVVAKAHTITIVGNPCQNSGGGITTYPVYDIFSTDPNCDVSPSPGIRFGQYCTQHDSVIPLIDCGCLHLNQDIYFDYDPSTGSITIHY